MMEKYAVDSSSIPATDDQLVTIRQLSDLLSPGEIADITVKTANQAEKTIKDLEDRIRGFVR